MKMFMLILVIAVGISMCGGEKKEAVKKNSELGKACSSSSGPMFTGKITQTFDASNYTYVQIMTSEDSVWAAAPKFKAVKGDMICFSGEMPMKDFESKSLKRTFPIIYFVNNVSPVSDGCCPKSEGKKQKVEG